ncbi:hypothetical protein [Spirochaeta isovalerica]|uniref:Drug/metabolite transporter (DMT)-like permease n=1 Tax=Spirochaeta isovalerica TaxID=150 RepID=A0A841RAR0_9SPIO|nr:hypothetical protein [Spirochaeta isovalerica]MBB6479768.1 drug/metabolite transporter (DMT)-like permease [Spirochaeta isovalerica]
MEKSGPARNIILFSLYFLFLWAGQLSSGQAALRGVFLNYWTALMYLCLFFRGFIWILILKKMDLIKAYALSSVNFLIVPLLSRFFLKENLELKYLLGASLIIPGILLFALGEKRQSSAGVKAVRS